MVLLGLELENNEIALDFMQKAKERSKVVNLQKNPYTDYEQNFVKKGSKIYYGWSFKHIYPDFTLMFALPAIVGVFLLFLNYVKTAIIIWLVSGIIVLINLYGRSKYMAFFALRINLRKSHYKGDIKLLSAKEMTGLFPDMVLKEGNKDNGSS